MSDFDYGNARLRVRASHWLSGEDYQVLVRSSGIDGLLGSLAQRNYGDDIERVLGRHSGLRRLDEAVRGHLSTQLSDVLSFYSEAVADRLRVYLGRWDIRNVRTILRSLGQRAQVGPAAAMLVAAGALDSAALNEVANQRDPRSAVDLLSVWRLPSPIIVRELRSALPRFSQTGDLAVLDEALDVALGRYVEAAASTDDEVTDLLRQEIDRLNLMLAVRLRRERIETGRAITWSPIAGGHVPHRMWGDLVELTDSAAAVGPIVSSLPPSWQPMALEWAESHDQAELEHAIDSEIARAAVRRFRNGDPLGIDIPLGYIGQQEAEARNLRFIARTVAFELPRDEAMGRLIGVA
jgi:vacuolar-type H+-ATPase subunit C/Vma6